MIILHGVYGSPFVRKVLAVLAIKDLPFKHIQQMPFARDTEYQKISPIGKVPAIQDGELTVSDSTVICEYLEDAYPANPVYPKSPIEKARARWYEELGSNTVAELAAGIFFQRFMRPMAFNQEPDEELVEKIITKKLPPLLDYIEGEVPKEGFLYGEIHVADISLVSPFINAGYAGYTIDAERWPNFASFVERVKGHEVMVPILEAEAAAMGFGS
ncbi:MAG: glutathione S-transferase [Halioglobus sp.]|jgi:glutathione S-transferase